MYQIARKKRTERVFSGQYNNHKEVGSYYCPVCGRPGFFEAITKGSIMYAPDNTQGIKAVEVFVEDVIRTLGMYLNMGRPPTGLRYCINPVGIDFEAEKKADKSFSK